MSKLVGYVPVQDTESKRYFNGVRGQRLIVSDLVALALLTKNRNLKLLNVVSPNLVAVVVTKTHFKLKSPSCG